jgi:hypothetical protein
MNKKMNKLGRPDRKAGDHDPEREVDFQCDRHWRLSTRPEDRRFRKQQPGP